MHPSFREGFEKQALDKQAWWGTAKQMGKDFMSGIGIGGGPVSKLFAGLTGLDVISKTKEMVNRPRGIMTNMKLN